MSIVDSAARDISVDKCGCVSHSSGVKKKKKRQVAFSGICCVMLTQQFPFNMEVVVT